MTPKLAWTALTQRAHVLHPNELGKGHPHTHTYTHSETHAKHASVLINVCIHNHKFTNGSGRDIHTYTAIHIQRTGWACVYACVFVCG